jgi:hypothetical protein
MAKAIRFGLMLCLAFIAGLNGEVAWAQTSSQSQSRIRFVHAAEAMGVVEISIGGAHALAGRGFKSVSDYMSVPAGDWRIQVMRTGGNSLVLDVVLSLAAEADYTLVMLSGRGGQQLQSALLRDDNQLPGPSEARIRLVNLAPAIGAVQATLAFSKTSTTLAPIADRRSSVYTRLPSGDATVRWLRTNATTIRLEPDTVYSLFVMAEGEGTTLGLSVDAQGLRVLLPTTGSELMPTPAAIEAE